MTEKTWNRTRIVRTALSGGAGALVGTLAEKTFEAITNINIADGLLEVGGALWCMARANRDILPELIDKVRAMFGKEPGGLSQAEWEQFCTQYPEYAETIKRYATL
ncbi:MAG TPA: hypothetical protein DF292_04675 [Firmicutes bacterium]|jgi:hypothetical protein|nr:hypothetical protein [Bacillota bacterium]